jgi:hypothetical protein
MAELYVVGQIDPHRALARLRTKPLNFDPHRQAEYTEANGWQVDDYASRLPPEPPGAPIEGGSWEIARDLSTEYRFVDPAIVRAFYDPDEALEDRTMLIEVHFWGLRIYAGVRVGDVFDGERERDGRTARVFAWNYRTLENHFEMGQISYEVWKWLDSGEIEFRMHAFSRRADPGNLFVRMGFLLFGRAKQVEFARTAGERMVAMTVDGLAGSHSRL